MKHLCENIQGCVFGYTQSDEITLILIDYQTFETQAWFDYEVQKMCSIAASMATMAFNKYFDKNYLLGIGEKSAVDNYDLARDLSRKKGAMFDARVFNIPKEEVANLIYWRQLDAIRNSVQMVGQANFPHKQLQGKSCEVIKEMLIAEKDISWSDFPTYLQRGSACRKSENGWQIDLNMPVIKENRSYIEDLIYI